QHAVPTPADAALGCPIVEVLRLAAHVNHAVDRCCAAEDLSSRLKEPPIVEVRLGLARVAPVQAWIGVELRIAERDVNPWAPSRAARLQQQDGLVGLSETTGDGAAGRACSDDNIVIRLERLRQRPRPDLFIDFRAGSHEPRIGRIPEVSSLDRSVAGPLLRSNSVAASASRPAKYPI